MTSYDAQAQDSFYSQQQQSFTGYQQQHDPRFIPNGSAGGGVDTLAPPYGGGDAHAHEGYQGLSFVEREPQPPQTHDEPYEPLYKHTRAPDDDLGPRSLPPDHEGHHHPQYGAQDSQGFDTSTNPMYDGLKAANPPPQAYDSFDQQFSYRYYYDYCFTFFAFSKSLLP